MYGKFTPSFEETEEHGENAVPVMNAKKIRPISKEEK
jgi:hypothetical protein